MASATKDSDGRDDGTEGDAAKTPGGDTSSPRSPSSGKPAKGKAAKAKPEPLVCGTPLVRGRLAEVGAIISGLLYFVSFPGFDMWPLTFVALVPLYLSLFGQPTKRAVWLGFLTGLSMNLGGFYWLLNMLRTFSGFPTPLCLVFVVIICSYQGSRLALMGWLHGRAVNRRWPVPVVFAAAFATSELVFPLLFPWYYAASFHKVPILMQLADVGGPILVGLVLVAVNLAIAEPVRAWLVVARAKANGEKVPAEGGPLPGGLPIDRRVVGVGVLALVLALVYGAIRIPMTQKRVAAAESAKVGYVQGNMALMQKREDPGEGLRRHRRMSAELRDKGADFVVWSESSVTFSVTEDSMKNGFFRDRFAASLQMPAIFGAVLVRRDPNRPDGARLYNTALATDAKGEITGRYDKQFLLAFGEYLPFGDTFPILYKWSPHSGRFSQGTSLEPVDIDIKGTKHKASVLICYEDILPGFTNRAVTHAEPELLVNMTNDAWFGDTLEPWQHLALAKFRAIEHRRFLIRSTNSGVSAIIDPTGVVVDGTLSSTFKAEAKQGVIHWLRGGTIYEVIGDSLWYLTAIGAAFMAFRRRKNA